MLQKRYQVRELHIMPVAKLIRLGPGNEFPKQGGVCPLGVLGLAALVAQILEKIFDQVLHRLSKRFAC